jgi:hypothetical protein
MKRNIPLLGLVIGLLLPLVGVLIVYLLIGRETGSLTNYVSGLFYHGRQGSMIISLSCLLNIIPFLFYTNKRLDLTARGILLATMLYFVLFILLKYVWA